MSRVGWFWPSKNAKSAETVDDEDEDLANDEILQTQLNSEITSQELSQNFSQSSPLRQKKKRKSREMSGVGPGGEEGPQKKKKKKKKKRRKSLAESNDDVGDFSTVLNSVLSHMDGTIGGNHSSPRVDRRRESSILPPPAKSNGPSNVSQKHKKDDMVPSTNGHVEPEVSSDDDFEEDIPPTSRHQALRNLSSGKTQSVTKPKSSKLETLKGSSPAKKTRTSSFASSNKEALLASIMKSCSSPTITSPGSMPTRTPPQVAKPVQRGMVGRKVEIPESSEPKEEVQPPSPEPTPEPVREVSIISASPEASSLEPEKAASPGTSPEHEQEAFQEASIQEASPGPDQEASRASSPEEAYTPPTARKRKRDGKSMTSLKDHRNSYVWKTASMRPPTLPADYMPGPKDEKQRYHCPVDTCSKAYSRKTTMGQHMNIEHAGAIYQDNENGTLSILGYGEDQESASDDDGDDDGDDDEDIPARKLVSKASVRTLNGNASAKKNVTQATGDEAEDSPVPQKKRRGRPRLEVGNDKLVEGGSRRNSRKNISYEEVPSNDEEPRARSLSASPQKRKPSLRSVGSVASILPPSARLSRSQSIMEPWEIAPGRIRGSIDDDKGKKKEENIAFSSAFIISNDHGVQLDGVHFSVLHLPGGGSHDWTSDETTLRVCSVASGKVHVTMGGKDFTIGSHGMWRIRGREICEVVNLNYGEAVVHISTLDED